MNNPREDKQKQHQPVETEQPIVTDRLGPPPDPRGTSESTETVEAGFDPKSVSIESHEEAFNAEDASDNPLTESGLTTPTPEMQINQPKSRLKRIITSKKFWFVSVLVVLAVTLALWFVQPSRIWAVNVVGLRVPVTVSVRTVAESDQPSALLQKAKVLVNGEVIETDELGRAKFMASYGQTNIIAEKAGYESAQSSMYLDFNPFFGLVGEASGKEQLIELQIKGVGLPLKFQVLDWLTELPVTAGEFTVGDAITTPDEEGFVSVKVPPTESKTVKVSTKVDGYTNKEIELTIQTDPIQQVAIVPAGKLYFISNRTGQLGVYSSNIDGGDVEEVVAPSANETSAIDFSPSPGGNFAVLASSREGMRDASSNLLQKLYVVNLQDGSLAAIDESRWFDFIDWSGDTLVYTAAGEGNIQNLSALNSTSKQKLLLDSGESFRHVKISLGQVVYALNHAEGSSGAGNNPELRVIPVVGGTAKNIGNKADLVTQTDYEKIVFRTSDNAWHEYNLNTATASNASAPTSTTRAFLANTSADGQLRLLVDGVDGVDNLIVKSVATGKETNLYSSSGFTKPIHWVGNLVTLRVSSQAAVTNYIMAPTMQVPRAIGKVAGSSSPQNITFFGFY